MINQIKVDLLKTAPELQKFVSDSIGKVVSSETVRKILRKHDYIGCVIRKKLYLSPKHKKILIINLRNTYQKHVIFLCMA